MAFCKNCGSELGEGAQFCPNCGTPVNAQPQQEVRQQYVQPEQETQAQYIQAQQVQPAPSVQAQAYDPRAKVILIMGIISLAVSWIPLFGIGGIILGAIGLGKSNAYVKSGGVRCGMSVTGRILSRVGLIVSICMTVFWIIYFIVFIGIIAWATNTHSYSGYHYY